jgi:hypothetical protein
MINERILYGRRSARARLATAFVVLLACGCFFAAERSAVAQISAEIVIGAPPPHYVEPPAPARLGYVWAPGYWFWDGRQYVWYAGHWEVARAEEVFVGAAWVQAPGGWRFVPGHWERPNHFPPGRGPEFCPPGQAKKGRC